MAASLIRRGVRIYVKGLFRKTFACRATDVPKSSKALIYHQYGDPTKVVSLEDYPLPEFDEHSIFVKILGSPINPADLNMIQGTYPIKPSLPAIGGNEGVGEVLAFGSSVQGLSIGDKVIMASSGLGCWTETNILNKKDILKIPYEDIPVDVAAMLSVNPCTAYRMLNDFENLCAGDVIMQNGANSGVGQAVIQLAANLGIVSVNVVRDRCNFEELKENLMALGATYVVTEEEFQNVNKIKEILRINSPPRLAFNCVGGKSSTQLIRYLSEKGTMVTYGGMSRKPIAAPTSAFIFKDVQLRGFWMTRWNELNSDNPERTAMLKELCKLIKSGSFVMPDCEVFHLGDFKNALQNSITSFSKKSLFLMR